MENKNDTISPANGDETSSDRATKDLMDGFLRVMKDRAADIGAEACRLARTLAPSAFMELCLRASGLAESCCQNDREILA